MRINEEIKKVAELSLFERNHEIRDASKQGLGAVSQQSEQWRVEANVSRRDFKLILKQITLLIGNISHSLGGRSF